MPNPPTTMDWRTLAARADERIAPHVRRTPLLESAWLSEATGATALLKLESLQHTGSFKLRGALNKVLSLTPEERARPIVTASTGNHGAAVAYALARVGLTGTVYVPHDAEPSKVARIERLGARVVAHGRDSAEAESYARALAAREGHVFISPYNDPDVVAGQGTAGLEIVRAVDRVDAIVVAVGGGGLISGVAGVIKATWPDAVVIGAAPRASAVMLESVRAGRILELESEPTLSDGTAGGVEADAITFPWCRDLVDEWDAVGEDEIAAAMRRVILDDHLVVEGSAAVAVASAERTGRRFAGGCVVALVCGGNVGPGTISRVLDG
ncbi:MAG: threonine/serine dehydratase [Gemmatimonadales bacterium]